MYVIRMLAVVVHLALLQAVSVNGAKGPGSFPKDRVQPYYHSDYNVIVYFPGVSMQSATKLSNIENNIKKLRATLQHKQYSEITTTNITTTTQVANVTSTGVFVNVSIAVSLVDNYDATKLVPRHSVVKTFFNTTTFTLRNVTDSTGFNVTSNISTTITTYVTTDTTISTKFEIHSVITGLSCLLSFYDTDISPSHRKSIDDYATMIGCDYMLYPDAGYADHIKALHPSLVSAAGFTHAMLLLDDVVFEDNFRLARLLHLMRLNNLSVGSPAIIYANVGATKLQLHFGEAYRVGKLVTALEIFATTFTSAAWEIFHGYVNPYFNTRGYLYERFFYYYALARNPHFHMGVTQDMTAVHKHVISVATIETTPSYSAISTNIQASRSRAAAAARVPAPPRTPKHFVDQSSFHDRYLTNATASPECSRQRISPKCINAVTASYKNKYNYHWDWVAYNKAHSRDQPVAGRTGGPRDGAGARLDMIE